MAEESEKEVEKEQNHELDKEEALIDTVGENNGKFKYGIIYLSYIPEGLNVKLLHEIMSDYGEVGRIYLEPERNNKKHRTYTEGWIEFKKKRVAKAVAEKLNGATLQYGRKRCKMNGQIWSIKYLHRFKWKHLTEQLAHDRAVQQQKRSFEMSQAKKQVDFYQKMMDKSKRMKKRKTPDNQSSSNGKLSRQNKPTQNGKELQVSVDTSLLSSIYKKKFYWVSQ